MKEGLKTYFQKYKFKNTELSDFITELSDAAVRLGMQVDLRAWSDSWLTSAGCSEFELVFAREGGPNGLISDLKLVQTPYNI